MELCQLKPETVFCKPFSRGYSRKTKVVEFGKRGRALHGSKQSKDQILNFNLMTS